MTVLTKELTLQLFHDHREAVVAFLFHRVRCRETAQDIAQEVYSRLLKMEGRIELMDCRAFLYRMAANLAADHYDHQQVRARTLDWEIEPETVASLAPDLESVLDSEQQLDRLWEALDAVPARCRHALLLSRFDGLTHAEIAVRLGVSVTTVERDIARALDCCHAAAINDDLPL